MNSERNRSSQADRKNFQPSVCCVTTRWLGRASSTPKVWPALRFRAILAVDNAFVVVALPHNAADGARCPGDVPAAAWQPAIVGRDAGIPRLGNSAGSSGAVQRYSRIPCEGRHADATAADGWPSSVENRYADPVPWEVMLPWAPPERFVFSLSGTFLDGWTIQPQIAIAIRIPTPSHTIIQPGHHTKNTKKTQKETRQSCLLTAKEMRRRQRRRSGCQSVIASGRRFTIGPTIGRARSRRRET